MVSAADFSEAEALLMSTVSGWASEWLVLLTSVRLRHF